MKSRTESNRSFSGAAFPILLATASVVIVLAGLTPELAPGVGVCHPGGPWQVQDLSYTLGSSYRPGSVQAFGSSPSETIIGGNGNYDNVRTHNFSVPVLLDFRGSFGSAPGRNLTSVLEPYFHNGGVFGQVWNGSAWLFTGFADRGEGSTPVVVAWDHGTVTDFTRSVGGAFDGQGIWAAAWNGSAWLLGGNSTARAGLVALFPDGRSVDLSLQVPAPAAGSWIQLLAWNGSGWLVGGWQVLGTVTGTHFVDALGGSPFRSGGTYAADWNGEAWLIGGAPDLVALWTHGSWGRSIALGATLGSWVNAIVRVPGGWILGGGGAADTGPSPYVPGLAYLSDDGNLTDLSPRVAAVFEGGYIQFAATLPSARVPGAILLVGEAHAQPVSLRSDGATALLYRACGGSGSAA